MDINFAAGSLVRIRPEWCDTPADRELFYVVIENNGDRLIVAAVVDERFPPQELVRDYMIEPAHA